MIVEWKRGDDDFLNQKYSRAHRWRFDGGVEIPASSSPHVVPIPMSDESAVDPEEAYIASLSSCHMLWFLAIAAKRGHVVDSYIDNAVGEMGSNSKNQTVITRVWLKPSIAWASPTPSNSLIDQMHERAHESCFIANSVLTEILIAPANG